MSRLVLGSLFVLANVVRLKQAQQVGRVLTYSAIAAFLSAGCKRRWLLRTMRTARLTACLTALALCAAGCGDDDDRPAADGRERCAATCARFKACIPNLKDSPSQIWVCRCDEQREEWSAKGQCIEACARESSCDDLWSYFRDTLTGAGHLYLTAFYTCHTSC